jgi:hypothetical protein
LNALLDWPMCMPSGYALFRDAALNAQLKRVLNYWCGFLDGPHSRSHLTTAAPSGWFCAEADRKIGLSQFLCDPYEPYWGFASWNSFFTRKQASQCSQRGRHWRTWVKACAVELEQRAARRESARWGHCSAICPSCSASAANSRNIGDYPEIIREILRNTTASILPASPVCLQARAR